ncbi:MAG: hypothetical protein AB8F34_09160 [Akkermansiaceae bacterium]
MRIVFQLVVIVAVLTSFGAAKLHFEDRLNRDMVEDRLIQPPLKEGTSLQLGQTGAAVALGGLRSLIAAMWNLRAFMHFENLDWIKLEESYEVITTLQPQTTHYWETGAWHLHTNASVHYNEDKKLSPMRRKALRKKYIDKGSAFLQEGVTQNPQDWKLHLSLARLWSDRHKTPDFNRAVEHYDNSLATDTMPDFRRRQYERFRFYSLARIPERQDEAEKEGSRLFHLTPDNHLPNLICALFALQRAVDIPENQRIPDNKLFPSQAAQYRALKNYALNSRAGFPMDGVLEKIRELEKVIPAKPKQR